MFITPPSRLLPFFWLLLPIMTLEPRRVPAVTRSLYIHLQELEPYMKDFTSDDSPNALIHLSRGQRPPSWSIWATRLCALSPSASFVCQSRVVPRYNLPITSHLGLHFSSGFEFNGNRRNRRRSFVPIHTALHVLDVGVLAPWSDGT